MSKTHIVQANIPTFGLLDISFFGKSYEACELYNVTNEFDRQKNMKHLGLISRVFDSVIHSRYDYLMLQCMLVDIFDKFHSSESIYNVGNLKLKGESESGNGILKAWFMLSNFGHAKNTLADEKALLYHLDENKDSRKKIIDQIKDNSLKRYARKIIVDMEYSKLHYVMGIARVYKEISSTNLKRTLIELYKLLLLEENEIDFKVNFLRLLELRKIFSTIRKLAIISIDSHYSHTPFSLNLVSITLNLRRNNTESIEFLNSILGALNKDLYLNREVLCIQQSYVKSARYNLGMSDCIDKIMLQEIFTEGLVKEVKDNYKVLTRIKLKRNMNNFDNQYKYLKDLKYIFREKEILINIDDNKYLEETYIDFCVPNNITRNELVGNVYIIFKVIEDVLGDMLINNNRDRIKLLEKLENNNTISLEDKNKLKGMVMEPVAEKFYGSYMRDVIGIFEDVFWDIVKMFFKPNFKIVANKNNLNYHHFDVVFEDEKFANVYDTLEKALETNNDLDRIHELNHLKYGLKRKYDGFKLYLIERATIFDATKPLSQRVTTDIDSLILKVSKNELIVEFNESKHKKKATTEAKKDLRKNFVQTLSSFSKGYQIKGVKGYGAKMYIRINS
ncbi:hypothetical protein [Sporosarcina sp. SAFN-010]|uniref:hypothetical protein n=1 Tax=Sporosarcina sp. SAFN-010 TaxID=3387273 RepID=UPI003F8018CC